MKRLLFFIGIIFSNNLNAQSAGRMESIRFVQEGDAFVLTGDWESTLFSYTNAVQADVDNAEAYMKRGQLFERTLHFQEAYLDYQQATALNPFITVYYDDRARFQMLRLDYFGALSGVGIEEVDNQLVFEETKTEIDQYFLFEHYYDSLNVNIDLFDKNELNEFSLQQMVIYYIQNGDYFDAKKMLDSANAINKRSSITKDLFGLLYMQQEDYNTALTYFNQSIELDSSYYVAYYHRSVSQRFLGNDETSLKDINTAISLSQNSATLFYKRGLIKKETGDLEGAAEDYESASNIDSNHFEAAYNLVFTNILLGEYDEAMTNVSSIKDNEWDNPNYWNLKGNVAILNSQYESAIEFFDMSISYQNDYAQAYYGRGIAYLLTDKPIQACEDFSRSSSYGLTEAEEVQGFFCRH
ncbi:MAG: tetratricopeptide repeat protein [Crocinitomicaceae bacterium]|nr:tetratricopeptide repeat protein [Crocinitomicaceae bacterium]